MGEYACYIDQNGNYQWTNIPDSNWQLVKEITSPDQIPSLTSNVSSTTNPEPTPGPAPIDYQTATTYRADNSNGSYSIIDKFSGNELYTVNSDGTVSVLGNKYFSKFGMPNVSNVSYDDNSGIISINNSDGKPLFTIKNEKIIEEYFYYNSGKVKVNKYDNDENYIGYEEHENGIITVYSKDFVKTKTIYEDGIYDVYEEGKIIKYDANDNIVMISYDDGSRDVYENNMVIKYDANGLEYSHVYEDGKIAYTKSSIESLIIYPDGTFYNKQDNIKGTYSIDKEGNIKCIDSQNNVYLYNSKGAIIQFTDNNGKTTNYSYDYDKMQESSTKNGKTHVARINHIEYDEEAYTNILKSFNGLSSSYKGKITSMCSTITSAVNSFPDSYSSVSINNVGSSIEGHIDLISSLSEMTNYSLLAYQGCDIELKDNLNSLIDSLFDSSELGEKFKNTINFTIEDRDNDGILEYKMDTDFRKVSDELIPTQKYTDENGNILYFNNKGELLSHDGNNFKIDYGGEDFILSFEKNDCAILRDSSGNPINIFGDYNIPSLQYGGDQKAFSDSLLTDENIKAQLNSYFPDATDEEKQAYLTNVSIKGCGYVAMTNMTFKMMEGHEEEFQDSFGYPMYNITYKNGEVLPDYNYEPLTLELFHEQNHFGNESIKDETENSRGVNDGGKYLSNYLEHKYNIWDYNSDESVTILGAFDYNLYDSSDNIVTSSHGFDGHAMTITDIKDDGTIYVSSWGNKYRYEFIKDEFVLSDDGTKYISSSGKEYGEFLYEKIKDGRENRYNYPSGEVKENSYEEY